MQILFPFFSLLLLSTSCQQAPARQVSMQFMMVNALHLDTLPLALPVVPKPYSALVYEKRKC